MVNSIHERFYHGSSSLSSRTRGHIGVTLRGGGSDEDITSSSSDDDNTLLSSDDESDNTTKNQSPTDKKEISEVFIRVDAELVTPEGSQTEKRHDIGSSYTLPSILWLSLAFDTILNKTKRTLVFPTLTTPHELLGPTASLSAGFFLAAGVFFTLSTNYFSEKSIDASYRDGVLQTLTPLLAGFGAVNLVGHSYAQPFLGASAAVIHGHNVMVAVNGWLKGVTLLKAGTTVGEELLSSVTGALKSLSLPGLFRRREEMGLSRQISSFGYLFTAYVTGVMAIMKIVAVMVPHKLGVFAPATIISKPLHWASISRLLLVSGLSATLKDASDRDFLNDVLFKILNGVLSVCSLAVAISFTITNVMTSAVMTPYTLVEILSLFSFSIFTAFNCKLSLLMLIRSTKGSVGRILKKVI